MVDEAGMADTLTLETAIDFVLEPGRAGAPGR